MNLCSLALDAINEGNDEDARMCLTMFLKEEEILYLG